MEKLNFDVFYTHTRDKLHDNQFGFRNKRSAKLQLLLFFDKLYELQDNTAFRNLSLLYLDFWKAFDTFPRTNLLERNRGFGIGSKLCKLIHSYLSNRVQFVRLGNSKSTLKKLVTVFPGFNLQTSFLSPLHRPPTEHL